jgi:hypothetical protein
MHPIAVDGAGPRIGDKAVPDLVGVFGQLDALDFLLALIVEQAQLDLGRSGGEKREVNPKPGPGWRSRSALILSP